MCSTGSKVPVVLLNCWILSVGGVAQGRVCACSLSSRFVCKQPITETVYFLFIFFTNYFISLFQFSLKAIFLSLIYSPTANDNLQLNLELLQDGVFVKCFEMYLKVVKFPNTTFAENLFLICLQISNIPQLPVFLSIRGAETCQ